MPVRKIVGGILSARELSSPPPFAKPSRARGAKRAGINYERAFATALGSRARHGVWFEGRDRKGPFWAQPDVLLRVGAGLVVFECKYTWVPEAEEKLRNLYIPLLETIHGCNVGGVVVCKKLTPESPKGTIAKDLWPAVMLALHGRVPILHWNEKWSFVVPVSEAFQQESVCAI